ncbi:MAG: AAA family ATPase [Patescibacteria group bacterium]
MLSKLSISGYKNIKASSFEITKLKKVNYLIGKNGAGKSSVLELIMMAFNSQYYNRSDANIDEAFGDPLEVFHPDFNFSYSYDEPEGIGNTVNVHLDPSLIKNGKAVMQKAEGGATTLPLGDIARYFDFSDTRRTLPHKEGLAINLDKLPSFILERDLRDFINRHRYTNSPVTNVMRSAAGVESIQLLLEDGSRINLKALSSGQIRLISIYFNLQKLINDLESYKRNDRPEVPNYFHIICIEEPETSLHPEYQKLVPKILNDLSSVNNAMFFVTTHSPFIVSKSGSFPRDQKVYLIDGGQTVDEHGNPGKGNDGFDDQSVNYIAAKMVGADETDFGYVENYCLLEEASLQKLLDALKKKGIVKNWGFISAAGANNVPLFAEHIRRFNTEQTLLKCNPFYYDKYSIIIDSPTDPEYQNTPEYKKMQKMNVDIAAKRFVVLSRKQIEDYYDNEMKNDFDAELSGCSVDHRINYPEGIIKDKYAHLVAKQIIDHADPRSEFKRIFDNELDFLLTGEKTQ